MSAPVAMASGADVWFRCPGCGKLHSVVDGARTELKPAGWFNGDLVKPTIEPSILTTTGPTDRPSTCHLYVRGGWCEFLPDCTHARAGERVPLEAWQGFD